jgi:signal transduction histidine kinase
MECPQFDFDFSDYNQSKLNELYVDDGAYAYFTIPTSEQYMLKFHYATQNLIKDLAKIRHDLWIKFILAVLLLLLLALFFTFYSLSPIRKALHLNDEFIRDILHDFNTPITSMVLNIKMFKEDYKENDFVHNISHSIDTISLLQNNLKSFLHHSPTQIQDVDVTLLTKERVAFIANIYPNIRFNVKEESTLKVQTHHELLTRILDNILSNAAKYNKPKGSITITITQKSIEITDTGKGIKNTHKVFERYYKEQDRGLGLGLPIVKKLTEQLHIHLSLYSKVNIGTTVTLDFSQLPRG